MNAEQRLLFEETLAKDEASLLPLLKGAEGEARASSNDDKTERKPRRKPLPEDFRRVAHHHEPENTNCPSVEYGKPMPPVGEDISERLYIVPAAFFVHRHIAAPNVIVQETAVVQIIDGGMPAAGLIAHTVVNHFGDRLPYYQMELRAARTA